MSNMSYCRFQNTLNDLHDCADFFEHKNLSADEHNARSQMIRVMIDIFDELGVYIDENDIDEDLLERR